VRGHGQNQFGWFKISGFGKYISEDSGDSNLISFKVSRSYCEEQEVNAHMKDELLELEDAEAEGEGDEE